MSKASASTKFRVVDVDALENQFEDDQGEDVGSSGPDEGEVNSLLASYPFADFANFLVHYYYSNYYSYILLLIVVRSHCFVERNVELYKQVISIFCNISCYKLTCTCS